MAVTVSKVGKVIVGMLDAELRAAGVDMSDPTSSVAWNSKLAQVTINAPAATEPQLLLVPGVVAAHTGATPLGDYARSHAANRAVFLRALYQLDKTVDLHTTAGTNLQADYQAALSAAMAVVNTLPQPYIDNLNKLRDLDGVAVAVASLTLAQCRQFSATLRGWLLTRATFADVATEGLD